MDSKRALKRFKLKRHSKKLKKHAQNIEEATTRHAHRFLISRWDKIREVRLHIIIWMAGVGALIALVGVQMVWFQQSYITNAAISGGTYAEAVKGPIQTLNPLFATTSAEVSASHLIFSSLYANDTTGHLKGDLAAKMTNKSDKVFTVSMKPGVKWSDGKPLTADDVIYTVELMKNPSTRSVQGVSWQGIGVVALNKYTVQFTLPAAYAAFPQALTFAVLPKHVLSKIDVVQMRESKFSTAPVGSGPFIVTLVQTVSQTTGEKIVQLDTNPYYYGGRPRLDHFQLHAYPDNQSIATALKTGAVTGAGSVTSDITSGLNEKAYDTVLRPVDDGVYVMFNLSQPSLKDSVVRRALQLATDTNAIRNQVYGHPGALYLPFIPNQVMGADKITAPKVDVAAASKLLDDDGWKMQNGVRVKNGTQLRLRVVIRENPDYEAALQQLASQWQKVGVQVDSQIFNTSDPSQNFTTDILQQRNYDVLIDDLVIGGDPDVFAYWHSQGLLNFSGYNNKNSDDDLSSARTTSDQTLRSLKYVAFAKQWLADVPAIGLYQPNLIYVHSKNTQAVQPENTVVSADDHYANILYWTALQGLVYKTP
ncbi:MAG: peptide ABC transporter substrate-binding protein [Candidatus Nomurabacteria bacterium]|nr:MAG: peptide ABC transporter substrate-binding protein [Candidatus Nomurabacteria bacterium]